MWLLLVCEVTYIYASTTPYPITYPDSYGDHTPWLGPYQQVLEKQIFCKERYYGPCHLYRLWDLWIWWIHTTTQTCNYAINLRINDKNQRSLFLITHLKELYDGILGIPWIIFQWHLIDWENRVLESPSIETAEVVLPYQEAPSASPGLETSRQVRWFHRSLCISKQSASPQCEFELP